MIKNFKTYLFIASLCVTCLTAIASQPGDISPGCDAIQQSTKMKGMEAFRGKVVYLDFWATWCPPCRKSMPALNQLRNELEPSGFEVVAINLDEKQDDAKQYLKKYPVNYPIIFDSTASCAKVYELKGMPTSYLIDRQGVIRDVHVGYRQGDIKKIRSKAQALLEEKHD